MAIHNRRRRLVSSFLLGSALLVLLLPTLPPFEDMAGVAHGTALNALGIWSPAYNTSAVVNSSILVNEFVVSRVNVTGGPTLNAFKIEFNWDPAVLNGVNATHLGGIFDFPGSSYQEFEHTVASGLVRIQGILFTGGQTVQGNGPIFTFTNKVVGIGSTTIQVNTSFSQLLLGNNPSPYTPLNGFFSNAVLTGDLLLISIVIAQEVVTLGDKAPITVGVRNVGDLPMADVTVKVYANSVEFNSTILGIMAPNTSQHTLLIWTTVGFSPGLYTISATVTTSTADAFAGDNTLALEQVNLVIHELELVSVTPNLISVIRNTTVTITAIVRNSGTILEQANVTIYANNTIIEGKCDQQPCPANSSLRLPVGPGGNQTFVFNWNTTGRAFGPYNIRGVILVIPGETNTANNFLDDGTVVIKLNFGIDMEIKATIANETLRIGENRTYVMTVTNKGVVSDSFIVRLFLGTQTLFQDARTLAPSEKMNFTFSWRTLGLGVGNYLLRANVTAVGDENALNDNIKATIQFLPNLSPKVSFIFGPASPESGVTVTFTATANDTDGTIKYYVWDFGDGTTMVLMGPGGNVTSHRYAAAGTYNVTLNVWDNLGAQKSYSQTISVKIPLVLYAGIGAGVGAAALGSWFVLSRRRKHQRMIPRPPKAAVVQ